MIRKGNVSSVDEVKRQARVTFREADNVVTPTIPYARGLMPNVGDLVAVAFFSGSMSDGLIFAVYQGG